MSVSHLADNNGHRAVIFIFVPPRTERFETPVRFSVTTWDFERWAYSTSFHVHIYSIKDFKYIYIRIEKCYWWIDMYGEYYGNVGISTMRATQLDINDVQISIANPSMEDAVNGMTGQKPDGTFDPGTPGSAFVSFDPTASGCNPTTQFCTPGATISWYINGVLETTNDWSGYDGSLGGYVASFDFTAPSSGSMTITAQSANTVTFTVNVSATDTNAGTFNVTEVYCANQPTASTGTPCACNSGNSSELTVYFQVEPTSVGNGIAYYNVIVNGTTILTNQVTSTTVGVGNQDIDSVSFTCPAAGSTIVIQPANGAGGSASLPSGGSPGGGCSPTCVADYCDPTTNTIWNCINGCASNSGVECGTGGGGGGTPITGCSPTCTSDYCSETTQTIWNCINGCASNSGQSCSPTVGGGGGGGGGTTTNPLNNLVNDFMNFYQSNPYIVYGAVGAVVLALVVTGRSSRRPQYVVAG